MPPSRRDLRSDFSHHVRAVAATGPAHARAQEMVNQQVAVDRLRFRTAQDQRRAQATTRGRRGRLPTVVALPGTRGDEMVTPGGERVTEKELQLTGLVPTRRQSGLIISLDQQAPPPEKTGETLHRIHGCGQMRSGRRTG
jgi:hypothetical protein